MTAPLSILNTRSQSIDTLWHADGSTKIKLAIGSVTSGSVVPDAAWTGVATHEANGSVGAGDGVVVAAGATTGDDVKRLLVDSNGKLLFGQLADDSAHAVGDYVFPIGARADEAATDSVDEGDLGILRMTLSRLLIIASHVLDDAAFGVGTGYVNVNGLLADESSTDSVDEGDAGAARMTLDRKAIVTPQAHAKGGASTFEAISAASNNATAVKASPGKLHKVIVNNINAAVRYIKFYDKASAPAPGSDTVKLALAVPAGTVQVFNFGDIGVDFATGIAFALVTGISQTDNTSVAASELLVNVVYV